VNEWLRLSMLVLAIFRLSELFAIDDGPFDIFLRLRSWLNKAPFEPITLRRTLADGLACRHCNGVWFAFLLVPLYLLNNNIINVGILILGVAGLQSIIVNKFGREV